MSLTKQLEEQLKSQRDKLLDLSGSNRLVDFKFKIKENARSQNYLRIVDEVPELIIDKLNVDKRFEVIPNTKEKKAPKISIRILFGQAFLIGGTALVNKIG